MKRLLTNAIKGQYLKTSAIKPKRNNMGKQDPNEITDGDVDKLIQKLSLSHGTPYNINSFVKKFREMKPQIESIDITKMESSVNRILECRKKMENIKYYQDKVQQLLKEPQPEQRTEPWYKMREGMLTASDWASALKMNPYSSENKLLQKKCGVGDNFTGNFATRWGVKYEPVANALYEKWNNTTVIEFGLLGHPNISFLGASPDGITPDGVMLEIKCPPKREITGIPPLYYWVQVQGQLEICDLERCDFLECKILEYGSREAFDEDSSLCDPTLTISGKEKGVIIEYINPEEEVTFDYAPLSYHGQELHTWCYDKLSQSRKDDYKFNRFIYWRLALHSCVPIYRDRKWFNDALDTLTTFWKKVEHYRKNSDELEQHVKKKARKAKEADEMDIEESNFYSGKDLGKFPF